MRFSRLSDRCHLGNPDLGRDYISYLTGVHTYLSDPVAIAGTADAVSFARARAARAGGLVANCVLAAIPGSIGSTMAVLIPAEKI